MEFGSINSLPHRHFRAATLAELLVIIWIVAVLMTVFLPALERAPGHAN